MLELHVPTAFAKTVARSSLTPVLPYGSRRTWSASASKKRKPRSRTSSHSGDPPAIRNRSASGAAVLKPPPAHVDRPTSMLWPSGPMMNARVVVGVVLAGAVRARRCPCRPPQSGAVERVDLPRCAAVNARWSGPASRRSGTGTASIAVRGELDAVRRRPFRDDGDAERLERLKEERLARGVVADAELDVVEHGCVSGES